MKQSDFKKYLMPVLGTVAVGLFTSFFYDVLKTVTSGVALYLGLAVVIIALSVAYSVFLIRYVRWQELHNLVTRTEYHHNFAHNARDLAVKLMPRKPLPPIAKPGEDPISLTGDSHYQFRGDLVHLLNSVVHMFELLVPKGVKVWACIRERRSDDCYHTLVRTSRCNTTRQDFTEPLHKDSKTIVSLKKSYKDNHDCVIITGSKTPDWHRRENDQFGEDLSVLMGAVLCKSWAGHHFDDPKLLWIICVNADRENVFTRDCVPLMKACNDVFSWLLNSFVRHDATKNNWPSAPRRVTSDLTA